MKQETINVEGLELPFYRVKALVVGSGAAGLNAADTLYELGQTDVAILTEGMQMGTSRNTGSDKQTYYKLTLSGDEPDSVQEMARTLFAGGSMHGDIALVEAALSVVCFSKLVSIGVPFPHDRYGQYAGYKTDHDPRQRATSCGPYTSRFMVEKLEKRIREKGIRIFDGYRAIAILTAPLENVPGQVRVTGQAPAPGQTRAAGQASAPGQTRAAGVLAIDKNAVDLSCFGLSVFSSSALVWATGGPGGIYRSSVYPESQTCATGAPLEAGAIGVNLTESQYGIASVKFRWNLSGTYQQVLPRYISTDADGSDEREFLDQGFSTGRAMLHAAFLKGYQWPFDAGKTGSDGSSQVDLLVYDETMIKGRRVFMDFRRNPTTACRPAGQSSTASPDVFDPATLSDEAFHYLDRSGALQNTPIERLAAMNPGAADLYREHGIDLASEPLEIAVCAQHNNGGLMGDIWWESNIRRLFPVGEVNGTFGARRPGGSALNSTQVGSLRAAQSIKARYGDDPLDENAFLKTAGNQIEKIIQLARQIFMEPDAAKCDLSLRLRSLSRMSRCGGHIRSIAAAAAAVNEVRDEIMRFSEHRRAKNLDDLVAAFIDRDILITQFAYLSAIQSYIERGGKSRGGYLISAADPGDTVKPGEIDAENVPTAYLPDAMVQETRFSWLPDGIPICEHIWIPVKPIPKEDDWFENIWRDYRSGEVFISL